MTTEDVDRPEGEVARPAVRIGLVGAGRVARKHLQAAEQAPSARVVGVCDVATGRARTLGRDHDLPVYPDAAALLERSGAEAVVVAVPTAAHAEVAVGCLEHGLPVLVEKPMATTTADCDRIIAAARARGLLVGTCHVMQRQHRRLRAAKQIIDSGALGRLVALSSRRTSHYRAPGRPAWMLDPSASGGGIMFNQGTYAIEEFQWLAGAPVRRVTGLLPPAADDRGRVETEAVALLELDSGVIGTVVELGTHQPASETLDVVFEDGSLCLSHGAGLWLHDAGGGTEVVPPSDPPGADYRQAMSYQLEDFARAVRAGRGTEADGAWGRSVVAVAQAVYASARTGGPVEVTT